MKEVVAALAGGSAIDKARAEGLHVAGERYVVFRAEGRSIYGRKVWQQTPFSRIPCLENTGQGGDCHLQDHTGHSCCPLR